MFRGASSGGCFEVVAGKRKGQAGVKKVYLDRLTPAGELDKVTNCYFGSRQKRTAMAQHASIVAVIALALATPALGQQPRNPTSPPQARQSPSAQQAQKPPTAAECRNMFYGADTNKDGLLSGRELVAAKLAEADDGPLTLREFVQECLDHD